MAGSAGTSGRPDSLSGPWGTYSHNIIDIAAGEAHSLLLKTDGTVWTMGLNDHGQLGGGSGRTDASYSQTVQVMRLVNSYPVDKDGNKLTSDTDPNYVGMKYERPRSPALWKWLPATVSPWRWITTT